MVEGYIEHRWRVARVNLTNDTSPKLYIFSPIHSSDDIKIGQLWMEKTELLALDLGPDYEDFASFVPDGTA